MKITQVSVSWKETHSLPGYSNVSPLIGLTATLEPFESAADVEAILLQRCKDFCHSEIDKELEANGQTPVFDTISPRYVLYQVYRNSEAKPVVIVPVKTQNREPSGWCRISFVHSGDINLESSGVRIEAARRFARYVKASEIIEMLDLDDLSKLAAENEVLEDETPF